MSPGKPFCPECGQPATGNFCQHCGAKLGGRFCNQCGAKAGPASAFCNQCGATLGAGASGASGGGGSRRAAAAAVVGGSNLPWWIAGVAMFGLILVVGVSMVQPGGQQPPAAGGGAPPAAVAPFAACSDGGPPPALSGMTSRAAADRLFNRVMTFLSQADTTCASMFMPMALGAYEQAQPLDHDGLFHLSLLNHAAGNVEDALANAQQILDDDPDHVLALAAAAEAERAMGDTTAATEHYQHLLDVFDAQQGRALPEYEDHQQTMTAVKSEAEAFLAGR